MSALVSCLLTLGLHLHDCDFDSRPMFLVSPFLSLYIHIHVYILLLLLYTIFLLTKSVPAWVPVKASFSTSDTIVTLYRHRSTNLFVSLEISLWKTPTLRWGWVFLEQTRILNGIQVTTHFIEIFVVQTKPFVRSFVNVILTRQTCGQRSSRAAESKRRALGVYFSERIWYIFLMSNCRGDWDLGLCTSLVLAKREALRNAKFRFFLRAKHVFFRKSPLRNGSIFGKYPKSAQT